MYEGFWTDMILNNLTVPAIVIVLGIGLKILQHYADKFVELFTTRQKTESMEKIAVVREKLVTELDKNTEAAVASNMDMVDKMKAAGHKLTEEQIKQVNDSAKTIIFKSLPADIGGMTAADILGGDEVLNSMIDSLMEKHVLNYKIKRGIIPETPTQEDLPEEIPVGDISDKTQFPEGYEIYNEGIPKWPGGSDEGIPDPFIPIEEYHEDPVPDFPMEEAQPEAPQGPVQIRVTPPILGDGMFGGLG